MPDIPKTIHYCWFGGGDLGRQGEKCINSWKKHLPDYEIICWNEDNFDVHCCSYVEEAYEHKMWAFVSDYARIKILYEFGGVYFDTDVEIVKPLDDIISAGPFMGFETDCSKARMGTVNPGLGFAVYPGSCLLRKLLDEYNSTNLLDSAGEINQTTIVERTTNVLVRDGLSKVDGIQVIDGIRLLPAEYMNPKSFETGIVSITNNTRTIHHYDMSWVSKSVFYEHKIIEKLAAHGLNSSMSKVVGKSFGIIAALDFTRVIKAIRNKLSK